MRGQQDGPAGPAGAPVPPDELVALLTRRGKAAALALARRLGLPAGEPAVLSSRGNLVMHLAPAPVVIRVATLSARSRADPLAWLAREVAVAGCAASSGGPVAPPASVVDPGPYWEQGFAVSLWDYVPTLDSEPSPADVGRALGQLHRAAGACRAELGDMSPVRELISEGLEALDRDAMVDSVTVASLRSVHREVLADLADAPAERIVLHGDAHAGNLLADARRGWVWIDLEETCRGPAAWDLATMVSRYEDDARDVALGAYARETDTAAADATDLAPFHRARMLEAAVWSLCMAQFYPARYADPAGSLLRRVLGG